MTAGVRCDRAHQGAPPGCNPGRGCDVTRTREELAQLTAGLLGTAVRIQSASGEGGQLIAKARKYTDEAWQGGRDELGRELADVLHGLIDAGLLASPAVVNAFGPLISSPDPGSHAARLAETFTLTSPEVPEIPPQVREAFDAVMEETGPPPGAGRHARVPSRPSPARSEAAALAMTSQRGPGKIVAVREINPAEAARLLGLFGERHPELAEFARRHAGPLTGFEDFHRGLDTPSGTMIHGSERSLPVGYPDLGSDEATDFGAVLHDPSPGGEQLLPLADDDSEPQAGAAEQRAGFSWPDGMP
jgi:hypothetical protein